MRENMEKQGFTLPTVVSLQPEQINEACQILTKAFFNLPVYEWIFPNINHRKRVLPWFFGSWVRYCLNNGEVITTPDLEGVGGCVNPKSMRDPRRRTIEIRRWHQAPLRMGLRSFWRARNFVKHLGVLRNQHAPPHPYIHVVFIGVDPSCRRIGVAKALYDFFIENVNRDGLPCYAETYIEKNLKIFSKFGFEVVHESEIPGLGIPIWSIIRWPKRS